METPTPLFSSPSSVFQTSSHCSFDQLRICGPLRIPAQPQRSFLVEMSVFVCVGARVPLTRPPVAAAPAAAEAMQGYFGKSTHLPDAPIVR